jgi:putative tryptophan/tyrosine transport system substrate-binding protein
MRRREVLAAVAGLAAWPLIARAQQPAKVTRIGFLSAGSPDAVEVSRNLSAFRKRLRQLGHVEGQNNVIDFHFAERNLHLLPQLAAELVELKDDVIVASTGVAALAATTATRTIPIVMANVPDPVGLGLTDSLARPSGNVTGLSFTVGLDTFEKALELLHEAVPNVRLVAVLSNPSNPISETISKRLEAAAKSLRVQLQLLKARSSDEFDSVFEAMEKERAGALLVLGDALFSYRLGDFALKYRLPTMHQRRAEAEAGGLMSYGPEYTEYWERAAVYVDKLLRGAKPSDLPVERQNSSL